MTGSALGLIVIPVVVALSLAAWLVMVFYADAHPQARTHEHAQSSDYADEAPPPPAGQRKAA
jgi:uncharacterized membrane protein